MAMMVELVDAAAAAAAAVKDEDGDGGTRLRSWSKEPIFREKVGV